MNEREKKASTGEEQVKDRVEAMRIYVKEKREEKVEKKRERFAKKVREH